MNKSSMLLDYGHGASNEESVGRVGVALVAASSRVCDSGRMFMAVGGRRGSGVWMVGVRDLQRADSGQLFERYWHSLKATATATAIDGLPLTVCHRCLSFAKCC